MEVPIVWQEAEWDCGIACVKMILQWSYPEHVHIPEIESGQPMWSIELFTTLQDYGISCSMYTLNIGGDLTAEHCSMEWYADETPSEKERVKSLFRKAELSAWAIHQASISVEYLSELIRGDNTVAILLVCVDTLKCIPKQERVFKGHYIIVQSVNLLEGLVSCIDPRKGVGRDLIEITTFDAARKVTGTDEDIIICARSKR